MKNENITERMEELNEVNENILREHAEPTIVVGYDLALMADDVPHMPQPKFTVRGEHNVWHVYENDERLEPPFRNQERAEIERAHYERSYAIRKGYNQTPNQGV